MECQQTLKAAILGTEDYHAIMRQIADSSLRSMVNYVPQRMKLDNPILRVHPDYLQQVDWMMRVLVADTLMTKCNPRSPYLVLAWLLVSSDNDFRICQYVDDVRILKQVAIFHICIALGDAPLHQDIDGAIKVATGSRDALTARDATWFAWSSIRTAAKASIAIKVTESVAYAEFAKYIAGFAATAATAAEDAARVSGVAQDDNVAWNTISTKARQWAHISDEEALQIARQLTLDILSL